MKRFWHGRGMRKFRKNRAAVVASLVIGVYLAAALLLLVLDPLGIATVDATAERVGAATLPGLFLEPTPERRLRNAEFYLGVVDRDLKSTGADAALTERRFGERRLADLSPDEMRARVDAGYAIYDELASALDLDEAEEVWPRLAEFEAVVDGLFAPLSGWDAIVYKVRLSLGTDRQGRSILVRGTYSIKVAVQIGVIVSLISVFFGSLLGAAAGFFGGWVDMLVIWLYSTFSAVPYLVLLVLVAYIFQGGRFDNTLIPVYVAFCMTFWIGTCRVVRGETLKLKELEYVQAATAVGFSRFYILVKHVLPNTAHLMFINFSLIFIGAIKSEVILSFLGLGVKQGSSWGIMISQSKQEVINGDFWQIGTATGFMVGLVLAFNVFTDALQDAFDPKHVQS